MATKKTVETNNEDGFVNKSSFIVPGSTNENTGGVVPGATIKRLLNTDSNKIILETNKEVYVNVTENIVEQKYINNGGGIGSVGATGATGAQGSSGQTGATGAQGATGSGIPAGGAGQVQYNNSGTFAGATGLTYNNSTGAVGMTTVEVPSDQSFTINTTSTGPASWYTFYGDLGTNVDDDYSSSATYDGLGNIYMIGANGSSGTPFIVKFNKNGDLVWQKQFNEPNNYYKTGDSIAYFDNHVYCVIGTDDDVDSITIFKISCLTGDIVWQNSLESPSAYVAGSGISIDVDNSGNIYVAGHYDDGSDKQILIRLNTSGTLVYQVTLTAGGTNAGYNNGMALDQSSWPSSVDVVTVGEYYGNQTFLVKYSGVSGAVIWQKKLENNIGSQVDVDTLGNIYVTGELFDGSGNKYLYLTKFDSSGNIIWQRNINYPGNFEGLWGVKFYGTHVYIAGAHSAPAGGEPSGYIVLKFDGNSGNLIWQRIFISSLYENYYWYWGAKMIDANSSTYIVNGWTSTPGSGDNAFLFQMPVDGSGIGAYGIFTYSESAAIVTNSPSLVVSGTSEVESVGTLVSNPEFFTLSNAGNTANLTKISGGSNTVTLGSNGLLSPGNYCLPLSGGVSGSVLTSNGAGQTYFDEPKVYLNSQTKSLRISSINDQIPVSGCYNFALGYESLKCNTLGNSNIAIGANTLQNNTAGLDNVAIGPYALAVNTTGNWSIAIGVYAAQNNQVSQNIAIGDSALRQNTTGIGHVAIGSFALACNTTGTFNTAVGSLALLCNTVGSCNFGMGNSALRCNTSGCANTAIGISALEKNCIGSFNIAIGNAALYNNTTGEFNIAVGGQALESNTIGYRNIAIGKNAAFYNSIGYENSAIGFNALSSNTTGNRNFAIGSFSLYGLNGGNDNVAMGIGALRNTGSGCFNVAIGIHAGCCTTGSCNTHLGNIAGASNLSGCNNIFLGNNSQGPTTTSSNTITLGNNAITCVRSQVTTISSLSDLRDKADIVDIPLGLQFILDLRPVKFTWNMRDGSKLGIDDTGFIAQEVLGVEDKYDAKNYLDMVGRENPDKLEIKPGKLIPILVRAIHEMNEKIEAQGEIIKSLQAKIV